MKKTIVLIFIIASNLTSFCQPSEFEAPDYKQIEKSIAESDSNLYYNSLMGRYLIGDSTMTLEEKRHVYYGYSFQDKYSPYGKSDYMDSLRNLFDVQDTSLLEHDKILMYSDSVLVNDPFNLNVLDNLIFIYQIKGNKTMTKRLANRITTVIDAVFSSGDGVSKKTALYVLYTTHEYFFIDVMGLQFGGSQSLTGNYDYLTLVENNYGLEGFYFEITPLLNSFTNLTK